MLERTPDPAARMNEPALLPGVALGVTLDIAGKRLVDSVDLTLEAGPVTVIMGPNGAGKTLLLRLLHGLITPTMGSISWGGRPLDDATRKRQAMVFQRPVLLRRSVAANIEFALALKGPVDRDERDRILAQVALGDLAGQPARLLSGGEQQRLALARALAMNPDVLFLDEPTASLDPASVLMIEQIVITAHDAGTRVVFVTHDIGQARRLAGDVVFLHRGRVLEHTRADQFFDQPESEAGRDFLAGRIVI